MRGACESLEDRSSLLVAYSKQTAFCRAPVLVGAHAVTPWFTSTLKRRCSRKRSLNYGEGAKKKESSAVWFTRSTLFVDWIDWSAAVKIWLSVKTCVKSDMVIAAVASFVFRTLTERI